MIFIRNRSWWLVRLLVAELALLVFGAGGESVVAQHEYKETRALLRDARFEEAVTELRLRMRRDPKDSEWVSQLAIAQARGGDVSGAVETIREAMALGAPAERFLAESRNLLAPVRDEEPFREWLAKHEKTVIHGPMLAQMEPTEVKLWLRTLHPQKVRAVAMADPGQELAIKSQAVATNADSDHTAELHLTGLEPDTPYNYRIEAETQTGGWQTVEKGAFQTTAAPEHPAKLRIAFGGGAGYVPQNERAWTTIAEQKPDALLLLGDNVYIDMPKYVSMQRFCYNRRHARPEFRSLVRSVPVYSIWDDHDFGTNDCSGGPEVDTPAWKPQVWNVFRENWANPGYGGGPDHPGCWYDFYLNNVHFIMLDGRYYRDRKANPTTMLGPEQKKWLLDTIKHSKGTFKVIASPVPWEFKTKGDSKDTWNGFREERAEIFDYLHENRIEGVVLISADRHRSDAWRIERPGGYPLYEFNSSRITNLHVHPEMKAALFSYNKKQSFGLITFDTTTRDPIVTYQVVNIDGDVVHELTVNRSQLSN